MYLGRMVVLAKVIVFGCTWAQWLYLGKNGCIWPEGLSLDKSSCIWAEWLYLVDVFGQTLLYLGKSC